MELAGLQEDTSSVNPTAKGLCQYAHNIDDFVSNCEGAGLSYNDVVHAVEELYAQTRDAALGIVARRWKALPTGGLAPEEKPRLSESRSYEICNAHKAFNPDCKSCQKRKALVENMPKATLASVFHEGLPPHRHSDDESLQSLYLYCPGGPKYDEPSFDNIMREMYGDKGIPEYVVECMNEATTSGQFIDMVRSREVWDDNNKTFTLDSSAPMPPSHDEELWKLACEVVNETMKRIDEKAKSSGSPMRYKKQHMLEQIAERLGDFHLLSPEKPYNRSSSSQSLQS